MYGPFKTCYNRALDGWMRSNPGKTARIYQILGCVNQAFMSAMTPRNITSGFRSCLTTEMSSPMQSLRHLWCQTGPTRSSRLHLQMMLPGFQPLFLPSYLHQALHSHVLHKVTQIDTQALLDTCFLLRFYHFPKVSSPGNTQTKSV